jgi:alkanesulfonate monooxygenase SsuD/methylene tetrahydromethanopterin reductase-like flavin-dependent oxidoreductase (luciferase family)
VKIGLQIPHELIDHLEETLPIAKHMWSGDTSPFEGHIYQLEEPMNNPPSLSNLILQF